MPLSASTTALLQVWAASAESAASCAGQKAVA